jgi:hypothetical protein
MQYPQPYSQQQRLTITPSKVVDVDIARASEIEDDAALAWLGRSADLL